MRVLTTLILAVSCSSHAFCESPAESDKDANNNPTSFWMEKKMDYAQVILRGLASADFESIGEGAKQMRLLNKVEGFIRKRNPDYRSQVQTFDRVCRDMIRQADKENLPGVTLAFNQLTVSCVNCHESLRSPSPASATNPTSATTRLSEDPSKGTEK